MSDSASTTAPLSAAASATIAAPASTDAKAGSSSKAPTDPKASTASKPSPTTLKSPPVAATTVPATVSASAPAAAPPVAAPTTAPAASAAKPPRPFFQSSQLPPPAEALIALHYLDPKKALAGIAPATGSKRPATATKKRPYRRTKRPKNYCDKSTITTTTDAVSQQNAYDAVLAESADLWQAAAEAQSLGRLKMASAYMLLLHARLVGLGKRFDKARQQQQQQQYHEGPIQPNAPQQAATASHHHGPPNSPPAKMPVPQKVATTPAPPPPALTLSTPPANSATSSSAATPKTQAAQQLAQMLPNHIELDTDMMEHLAKAAAELHAARSGRNKQQVLQSPNAREFLAGTANTLNLTNAATAACRSDEIIAAWHQGKSPAEIATMTGRTEQQVRALVRSQEERERLAGEFEAGKQKNSSGGSGGSSGRKPVTTAMNTVPNANCNAAVLLRGGSLKHSEEAEKE